MKAKKRVHDRQGEKPKGKSKSAKRRARQIAEEDDEERRLTSLLFGGGGRVVADEPSNHNVPFEYEQDHKESTSSALGFEIDRAGAANLDSDNEEEEATMNHPSAAKQKASSDDDDDDSDTEAQDGDRPAWVDEDDEKVRVNLIQTNRLRKLRKSRDEQGASALDGVDFTERLRERYKLTMQRTARTDWAEVKEDVDKDEKNEKEAASEGRDDTMDGPLLRGYAKRLQPNLLNVVRCPDANMSDPCNAVVQSVHFHPGSEPDRPLMLTAGLDKTLRFFQVGAEESVKVHGIHCKFS